MYQALIQTYRELTSKNLDWDVGLISGSTSVVGSRINCRR